MRGASGSRLAASGAAGTGYRGVCGPDGQSQTSQPSSCALPAPAYTSGERAAHGSLRVPLLRGFAVGNEGAKGEIGRAHV